MKYDISKTTAPKMPNLGRGLESVALLLSQVSKDMHQPIVPMLFPILGAHVSGAEFMYPDLSWKEPSGMLANLVADSGAGKGRPNASRSLIININNRNSMKNTKAKETHKCKPQEAMVSST